MAKLNLKSPKFTEKTHEGAPAARINALQQLRRSVLACMLWEDGFYESGEDVATRIKSLVAECNRADVAALAVEARTKQKLRHAPLLLARELARHPKRNSDGLVSKTLCEVIQRADELAEFLALYWADGKQPLSKQVKKGLACAFNKFDEYALAKYNRDDAVKLRDVLFMVHAKPKDDAQAALWKRLVDGGLVPPDTWEVALSGGADKRQTWERLISERKLGALAFIRNLRNMGDVKVDKNLVANGLRTLDVSRVLPFRFIAAAKAAPQFENEIDELLLRSLSQRPKINGRTVVVIDVSGSMYGGNLSKNSDMNRALAACALGAIAREIFSDVAVYATAGSDARRIHKTALVPNRHGMALVDAIFGMCRPLGGGGIFLNQVCKWLSERESGIERMIVITDEQDCAADAKDSPTLAKPLGNHNYLINVSTDKNGVGYGAWTHIDGWSEAVFDYIGESEQS